MRTFKYTVTDSEGIHARPAGALVKLAKIFSCNILVQKNEKSADCKKIFNVLGLGAKCNDTLQFMFEGTDEDTAAEKFTAEISNIL